MNLLVVSSWCPFPLDNGSRLRVYNLLKQLASRGHTLTLLALSQPETDAATAARDLETLCAGGVRLFPPAAQRQTDETRRFQADETRRFAGHLSLRPRSVVLSWQPDMARAVCNTVQSKAYDRALFLEPGVLPYAPPHPAVPCLLDCMEVTRFTWQAGTLRVRLMRAKLGRYLRGHAARFALWTAVSVAERDAISAFVGRCVPPLRVLPNGVDLERNAFGAPAPGSEDRLVLNGAPDFAPNREGAEWFATHVLPVIRQARPAAQLWVTGRADTPPVHTLRQMPGVTLTGFLDDVRPAVREASVCVVPLLVGGGTRLKILEAMALGVPVVSTRVGAEGIEAQDGEHLLIADTSADFARAVLSVMENALLRERLRRNARRLVEHAYGWDAIGAQLDALLRDPLCL